MSVEWAIAGAIYYPSTATIITLLVIPASLSNLLISVLAKLKQRKWEQMSDSQIRNEGELKHQKYPQLASVPSVDEIKEILLRANLGDTITIKGRAHQRSCRSPILQQPTLDDYCTHLHSISIHLIEMQEFLDRHRYAL